MPSSSVSTVRDPDEGDVDREVVVRVHEQKFRNQAKQTTGVDPAGLNRLIELIITTGCVDYIGGGDRARKND